MLTPAVVFGQFVTNHYVTYNHFRCTDNICAPAKVKSNTLGTFYVYYDDTVVEGDLGYWEACDCNGNRIVTGMPYTHTQDNDEKRSDYYYVLDMIYTDSSTKSSDSNTGKEVERRGEGSNWKSTAAAGAGTAAAGLIAGGLYTAISDGAGETYPNLQIQAGASHICSEFLRLKWMLGGSYGFGFVMFGGVGKEMIFDNKNYKLNGKHIPWHVGLGMFYSPDGEYGDGTHDFTFGLSFAETPAVENYAMMVDLTWSKFFGESRRFGIFIGTGIGLGNMERKDPEIMWDANVGITFKLWQHN